MDNKDTIINHIIYIDLLQTPSRKPMLAAFLKDCKLTRIWSFADTKDGVNFYEVTSFTFQRETKAYSLLAEIDVFPGKISGYAELRNHSGKKDLIKDAFPWEDDGEPFPF